MICKKKLVKSKSKWVVVAATSLAIGLLSTGHTAHAEETVQPPVAEGTETAETTTPVTPPTSTSENETAPSEVSANNSSGETVASTDNTETTDSAQGQSFELYPRDGYEYSFAENEVLKQLDVKTEASNSQRVDLTDNLDKLKALQNATVYLEFKTDDADKFISLFSASSATERNEYFALYANRGQIGIEGRANNAQFYDSYASAPLRIQANEWNAVAVTIEQLENNRGRARVYVNGVLSKTSESATSGKFIKDLTNVNFAQLGAIRRANNSQWGGNLDIKNFTVYNKALSANEIKLRSTLFERQEIQNELPESAVLTEGKNVFQSGESGVNDGRNEEGIRAYRIPSLLVTDKGTIIAGGDERTDHNGDWGNINMVVKRSVDGGQTWGSTIKMLDLRSNTRAQNINIGSPVNIDMVLAQHPETKRIFAVYDMFPEGQGIFGMSNSKQQQYTEIEGKKYLNLYSSEKEGIFTVREEGFVYNPQGIKTDYRVVVEPKEAPYSTMGDLYQGTTLLGNVYFTTMKTGPFRVAADSYLWMSYSDDDGQTWSAPKDITPGTKLDWMKFHGVGPGVGLVLRHGQHKGRIVIPSYSTNYVSHLTGSQSARVIYSDDNGETWHVGESVNDGRIAANGTTLNSATMNAGTEQTTEASVIQLKNGDLKMFMRNTLPGKKVVMATSKDGGATWENEIVKFDDVNEVYVQLSAIHYERDGKEYVILANANGPGRNNGHVRVAEVDAQGNLTWLHHQFIQNGKFAYNALQQIDADNFGILYEHASGKHMDYNLVFKRFNWEFLTHTNTGMKPANPIKKTEYAKEEGFANPLLYVEFEAPVLSIQRPNLLLSNGREAQFIYQIDEKNVLYSIKSTDYGTSIVGIKGGDLVNVNGMLVNVKTKLPDIIKEIPHKATDVVITIKNADAEAIADINVRKLEQSVTITTEEISDTDHDIFMVDAIGIDGSKISLIEEAVLRLPKEAGREIVEVLSLQKQSENPDNYAKEELQYEDMGEYVVVKVSRTGTYGLIYTALPKPEEPKPEEPKPEEPKPEEPKPEEPKPEEPKPEEPKPEEPKPGDSKPDTSKPGGANTDSQIGNRPQSDNAKLNKPDATISQQSVYTQAKANQLPNTAESKEYALFSVATLSILVGLGIIKHKEQE